MENVIMIFGIILIALLVGIFMIQVFAFFGKNLKESPIREEVEELLELSDEFSSDIVALQKKVKELDEEIENRFDTNQIAVNSRLSKIDIEIRKLFEGSITLDQAKKPKKSE